MKEKCETYKAKGILGCRRGKTYAAAAKENTREETKQWQRESENTNRREKGMDAELSQKSNWQKFLTLDFFSRTKKEGKKEPGPHETRRKT